MKTQPIHQSIDPAPRQIEDVSPSTLQFKRELSGQPPAVQREALKPQRPVFGGLQEPVQLKEDPEAVQFEAREDYTHMDVYGYASSMDNEGNFTGDSAEERKRVRKANKSGIFKTKPGELKTRILMLEEKILEAYRTMTSKKDETDGQVLGVFTAPEWFFKRPGKPFSASDKETMEGAFKALSDKCPEMMLIPGSIMWAAGSGSKARMHNTAMVFLNGAKIKEHNKHGNMGDTDGYSENKKKAYEKASEEDETDTKFNVGNLSMSLEICGDHSSDSRARKEDASGKTASGGVDVQIIISHGAGYSAGGKAIREGGIVVSNDGANPTHRSGEKKGQQIEEELGVRRVHENGAGKATKQRVGKDDMSELRVGDGTFKLPTPTSQNEASSQLLELLDTSIEAVLREVRGWKTAWAGKYKPLHDTFESTFKPVLEGCDYDTFVRVVPTFIEYAEGEIQKMSDQAADQNERFGISDFKNGIKLRVTLNNLINTSRHINEQSRLYQKSQGA